MPIYAITTRGYLNIPPIINELIDSQWDTRPSAEFPRCEVQTPVAAMQFLHGTEICCGLARLGLGRGPELANLYKPICSLLGPPEKQGRTKPHWLGQGTIPMQSLFLGACRRWPFTPQNTRVWIPIARGVLYLDNPKWRKHVSSCTCLLPTAYHPNWTMHQRSESSPKVMIGSLRSMALTVIIWLSSCGAECQVPWRQNVRPALGILEAFRNLEVPNASKCIQMPNLLRQALHWRDQDIGRIVILMVFDMSIEANRFPVEYHIISSSRASAPSCFR